MTMLKHLLAGCQGRARVQPHVALLATGLPETHVARRFKVALGGLGEAEASHYILILTTAGLPCKA